MKSDFKIQGHKGLWYMIDTIEIDSVTYYLCESCLFGEDAPHIIINHDSQIVLENVHNGFEDLFEELGIENV